jgi:hypothetical protein
VFVHIAVQEVEPHACLIMCLVHFPTAGHVTDRSFEQNILVTLTAPPCCAAHTQALSCTHVTAHTVLHTGRASTASLDLDLSQHTALPGSNK